MKKSVYLDLIGTYWICQEHFGLSSGATALYFYLLHKFNDARWPQTLGISSLEIGGVLGISKPTLLKFKDELAATGLVECNFLTGKIRQEYELRNPKLMFDGVEFEGDSKVDGKADSKVDSKDLSQNSLPTYNNKTKTKTDTPYSPPDRGREKEKQASAIYEAYPRKVGRPVAIRAIRKHIDKVGFDTLLEKTQAYAQAVKDSDPKFIPHPSTWYSQERFNDSPESWNTSGKSVVTQGNIYRWMNREKELKEQMRNYKNAHRSEMALGTQWDPGTREKYNEMAKELEELRMTLDEIST